MFSEMAWCLCAIKCSSCEQQHSMPGGSIPDGTMLSSSMLNLPACTAVRSSSLHSCVHEQGSNCSGKDLLSMDTMFAEVLWPCYADSS